MIQTEQDLTDRLIMTSRHLSLMARMLLKDIRIDRVDVKYTILDTLAKNVILLKSLGRENALEDTWTDKALTAIEKFNNR